MSPKVLLLHFHLGQKSILLSFQLSLWWGIKGDLGNYESLDRADVLHTASHYQTSFWISIWLFQKSRNEPHCIAFSYSPVRPILRAFYLSLQTIHQHFSSKEFCLLHCIRYMLLSFVLSPFINLIKGLAVRQMVSSALFRQFSGSVLCGHGCVLSSLFPRYIRRPLWASACVLRD